MIKTDDIKFHGPRLRLARTFHGITLAQLGEKAAASRQYMQRLESDPSTAPSREMLYALSEILSVEPLFFSEPIAGEVREEECHFRKLRTTPQNVRFRALSYGTIFSLIVVYLEQHLNLPKLNIPSIKVASREDIERAAETCRRHWGLGLDTPIDNMTRTLENFGCVVTTFEGVSEKIDAFSYVRSRPIIVRNTDKGSPSRSRFDLAHECGHLVMHQDIEVGDPDLEEQAHQFASAFLLPRAAFIREYPKSIHFNWNSLIALKKRWGVSLPAIIRRAYDLGLISAVQYRNANVHCRKTWKHGDTSEGEPAVEPMEVIPSAFETIRLHQNLTSFQIAQQLHMTCAIIEKFGIACEEAPTTFSDNKIVSLGERRMKRVQSRREH